MLGVGFGPSALVGGVSSTWVFKNNALYAAFRRSVSVYLPTLSPFRILPPIYHIDMDIWILRM